MDVSDLFIRPVAGVSKVSAFHVLHGTVLVTYDQAWQQTSPSSLGAAEGLNGAHSAGNQLSARQREVLHLIAQGHSNKEIVRALNLAEGTVKIHVAALFGKLGVHRRSAVATAGATFLSPVTKPSF
jgi:DNA-binding NarL/FixJ family response regulator